MKYHTTISTILISVSVALMFAAVGFFIIINLNMTSPTLIAANRILDEIESVDSRFTISFESMDRNFRDGVFINGLKIEYDNEEILHVNKLSLNKGLFSLAQYIVSRKSMIAISADYAELTVPNSLYSSEKAGDNSHFDLKAEIPFNIPEMLNEWGFLLDIYSLTIRVGKETVSDIKVSLDWYYGLRTSKIAISVPELKYDNDDLSLYCSALSLSAKADDSIVISLSADSFISEKNDFFCDFTDINISGENYSTEVLNPGQSSLRTAVGNSHIVYGDTSIDLESIVASYISDKLTLIVNGIDSSFSDLRLGLGSIGLAATDLNDIRISASALSAYINDERLLDLPEADISVDIVDRIGHISFPTLSSEYLNSYSFGFLNEIRINDASLNIGFSDSLKAELSSGIQIVFNEPAIGSVEMDSAISIVVSKLDNGYTISSASANLKDISSKLFKRSGYINAELKNNMLYSDFDFGDTVYGALSYEKSLKGSVTIDSFSFASISSLINSYAPAFYSYIGDDTSLNGSIGFDLSSDASSRFCIVGPVSAGIGIQNIRFNEYSFNLGASFSGSFEDDFLYVSDGALSTDWVRAGFSGGIDFANRLPYGDFSLAYTSNGKHIVDLKLGITGDRIYLFDLTTPYLESAKMSGTLDFSKKNLISSHAELETGASVHEFGIDIDFENKNVILNNPRMRLYSSWLDKFIFESDFDDFPLLTGTDNLVPCLLDGDINFSFDFAKQSFELQSPVFSIRNLRYFSGSPNLSFSIHGDNNSISVKNISIKSDDFPELTGEFLFDISRFGLLLQISDGTENGENVLLSIIKDQSLFTGILNGKNIRLGRFGQPKMIGDINLAGSGNSYDDFAFTGSITGRGEDVINDSMQASSTLFIDSSSIILSDIEYASGSLSVGIDSASLDSVSGRFDIRNISYMAALEHKDRVYPVSFAASVSAELPKEDNLIELCKSLFKSKGEGISFSGSIDTVNYDNSLIAPKRDFSGIYSDMNLMIRGEAISGNISLRESTIDIDVDLMPIAKFRLNANMNGQYGTDYYIDFDSLAVSLANLSINSPILVFYDPAYIYGNLDLIATADGYRMYGKLDSDRSEFDLFWLPGERIILHNPSFIVWDNVITSNLTDFTCMNLQTNRRVPGKVKLELGFGSSLSFESYEVDVYLNEGDEVNYRLPMMASNIDLVGKVSGHYHIDNITGVVASTGDLRVRDTTLSIGLNELPDWFTDVPVETSSDFNLTLVSNCRVIFPLSETPILTAFAENNTKLLFHSAKDGMRLRGDFSIRSGEIYYFQKYFYITEGKFHFEDNQKTLNPLINLRARLRDFDSDGKQVDIYLNLINSKLDDLNPTFESSPSKSLSEIMQILGQAILPSTAYGKSSLTSVASLLTASVDILSRVGIIKGNGTGLDQSIKNSLGLDVVSLHSNIVSNMLTDTIALSGLGSATSSFSPMARYMNGTSIYAGKYILPNVYMQVLFHLTAEESPGDNRHTFLSDDLVLDSELSAEWETPLCTVTLFTKPVNFTFYSILDGFGFTLSKRIIF